MCQYENEFIEFRKIVGKNIRLARKKCKLTQEEFAEEIDTAAKYIGCIERGEKVPSMFMFYKMAKTLKITISDATKDAM